MKKYISIALVFAALAGSGCRSLVRNADEIVDVVKRIVIGVDPPPPSSTEDAARALTKFIQAAGRNGDEAIEAGRAAGVSYVRSQQNSGDLISQSTLEEVIFQTILEEVEKTGQQIVRARARDAAMEVASEILASVDNDEEME